MCKPCQGGKAYVTMLMLVTLLLVPAFGVAGIQEGAAWLVSSQLPDGSIHTAATRATPFQATAEALITLSATEGSAAASIGQALAFVESGDEATAEYLARRVLAGTAAGSPSPAALQQLLTLARPNGGIAPAPGFDASALDTAFALSATRSAGTVADPEIEASLGYLLAVQGGNGGWRAGSSAPGSYVTALASIALQGYRLKYSVGDRIAAASGFLLQAQHPDGGWGNTVDTAVALLALIPVTTDSTRYAAALAQLGAAQQADGSWDGDVFATALAMRALLLAASATPPSKPTTGSISAQVVDASSGAVLEGVSVSIAGPSNVTVQTGADGRYLAAELTPGSYIVSYSKTGYLDVTQSFQLEAGQQRDLGTVRPPLGPQFALLTGVVTDVENGAPIPGASVSANSQPAIFTAADGSYAVTFTPGAVSITVSAAGYHPVSASGSATAGATLTFSPGLSPLRTEPPIESAGLRGTVIDADNGLPVPGALVTLAGSGTSVHTDADGRFMMADLSAGNLALSISHSSYEALAFDITTTAGTMADLGALRMRPVRSNTTSVSGVVVAGDTGKPLAGATVVAGGIEAETGADGDFLVEGIPEATREFNVYARATGYLTASQFVSLEAAGRVNVNLRLQHAGSGGLTMPEVTTDRSAYGAYSEVVLSADLRNASDRPRVVRLYLDVYDAANQLVEQKAGIEVDSDPTAAFVTVAAGGGQAATAYWRTAGRAPGQYRIVVQALDAYEGNLLAEQAVLVQVEESREIAILVVRPQPAYITQGTAAEIAFAAQIHHRSNAGFTSTVQFSLVAPNGEVLHTGSLEIPVQPEVPIVTIPASRFTHVFAAPGEYAVRIDSVDGPQPRVRQGRPLYVAPDTRVDIEQGISPRSALPGAGQQINLQIRLKGVAP